MLCHGLKNEIVERAIGVKNEWLVGEVTVYVPIKGFGGATLLSTQPERMAHRFEQVMGLEKIGPGV